MKLDKADVSHLVEMLSLCELVYRDTATSRWKARTAKVKRKLNDEWLRLITHEKGDRHGCTARPVVAEDKGQVRMSQMRRQSRA